MTTAMRGGTARDVLRETDGGMVARFAAILGYKLLPWQRYVADVAGEIDPETGTYYYDTVVLSTPRQVGKSTLVDSEMVRNSFHGPQRSAYYLAQTGKDASNHFKKLAQSIQQSPLAGAVARTYYGAGDVKEIFVNGSVIQPSAATRVSGHGVQGDFVCIDEAFSFSEEEGSAVLDGFLPTTATRMAATGVRPQLWLASTEGTSESTFFNARLDSCRAGDIPRRTCWFDYGVPLSIDSPDFEEIFHCHPAAGLLWRRDDLDDFRAQFGDDLAGFLRAYGNIRDKGVADTAIPRMLWADSSVPSQPASADHDAMCLGVAVDIDSTHTSLSVATFDDGITCVQLVDVMPGVSESVAAIRSLAARWRMPVCIDSKGTSADLYDRLRRSADDDGIEFAALTPADYLTAPQSFVNALQAGTVVHAASPELDDSAANTERVFSGDAWRFARRGATGLTSPLESAVLAAWGVSHLPAAPAPLQIF